MHKENKKPIIIFTTASKNLFNDAVKLLNSLRKFHNWPVILVTDEHDPENLKKLPGGVTIWELGMYLQNDRMFFYRQKPVIASELIKDYKLVLGLDSDQIIVGDLSYLEKTSDYDVGTVINWNRVDPGVFGVVQAAGILPVEYFNCGLVAMRSEAFVKNWLNVCISPQFDRLQYKEQDILNYICYYGNYNVRCFDHDDKIGGNNSWWGLLGKGEYPRAKMIGNDIVIPKGEGDTPFPPIDIKLNVLHWGGGNDPQKGNYRKMFQDDVIKRLDYLVSDEKK